MKNSKQDTDLNIKAQLKIQLPTTKILTAVCRHLLLKLSTWQAFRCSVFCHFNLGKIYFINVSLKTILKNKLAEGGKETEKKTEKKIGTKRKGKERKGKERKGKERKDGVGKNSIKEKQYKKSPEALHPFAVSPNIASPNIICSPKHIDSKKGAATPRRFSK